MKRSLLFTVIALMTSLVTLAQSKSVLWSEDFEGTPTSDWSVSSGVWEFGIPTIGPNAAHGGTKCAATVLNGNYPSLASTRVYKIAYFTVPNSNENPQLRFWHWFSFSSGDYGKVQIHVQGTPSTEWIDVSGQYINTGSSVWTYPLIDLSAYAGQSIQVGFYLYSDNSYVSSGWYIDDVSILTGAVTFNNPETWENGIGDWNPEAGTWEVGTPSAGLGTSHGGTKCAGTNLAGSYDSNVDSKLISPTFMVPAGIQNPRLRFWHWFSFSSGDYGKVQVRVNGTTNWIDVSGQYINTGSSAWSYPLIDLSVYAGQSIQIGFYLHSDNSYVSTGWYIDDISIVTGPITFNNPETWENGIGDWNPESGTWETGSPAAGPVASHSGTNCAGTNLAGDYDSNVDSRLISPPFHVPSAGQSPILRFWHWYSFSSGDYGKVMLKVEGNTLWEDLSQNYVNTSGGIWSYPALDLSSYSDKTVRISFLFHSDNSYVSTGWYIDDIQLQYITGIEESQLSEEGFLQIYPNPADDIFYIEFPNPDHKKYDLTFYSLSGEAVSRIQNITTDKVEIGRNTLPAGIYFVRLKGDRILTGKVLVK